MGEAIIARRGGGGSKIKSVQRGSAVFGSSDTTINVSISNVKVDKTLVIISLRSDSQSRWVATTGVVTSETNLSLQRGEASGTLTVHWEVVEYVDSVKIQTGQRTLSAGTSTANFAVSTVDLNKSFLPVTNNWRITGWSSVIPNYSIRFNNASQLGIVCFSEGTKYVRWYIVEE